VESSSTKQKRYEHKRDEGELFGEQAKPAGGGWGKEGKEREEYD
jgi:hypothetical protein